VWQTGNEISFSSQGDGIYIQLTRIGNIMQGREFPRIYGIKRCFFFGKVLSGYN